MSRFLIALALWVPLAAFAQEDTLRAQIRADLMQDPRTAELSEAELDALVAALANEAEATGEAETYLDVKAAPTFTYDLPPVSDETPLELIVSAPIVIAVCAFLAGVAGLVTFMIRQRRKSRIEAVVPTA